jgi:hypothetical protein
LFENINGGSEIPQTVYLFILADHSREYRISEGFTQQSHTSIGNGRILVTATVLTVKV